MKNRQSKQTKSVSAISRKTQAEKVDQEAQNVSMSYQSRGRSNAPTKSQINRLKKFNNTTRWLPNSAFTTFFGKPAFENYGFGNTKPTYGGLFYGNYMLSHNINPIDGDNLPQEKQVYASAMLKSSKCLKARKPEPPRKVPDEIRNTPEELKEINSRNPIFQKPNNFANREIKKPNLLRAAYFKSPKGTRKPDPNNDEFPEDLNEEFDLDNLLNGGGEFKKKKKIVNCQADYEFFAKNLKKKNLKEQVDNKNLEYLQALKQSKAKTGKDNQSLSQEDAPIKLFDRNSLIGSHGGDQQVIAQQQVPINPYQDVNLKEFLEKMLEDKPEVHITNKDNLCSSQDVTNDISKRDTQANSFRTKLAKKENPCLLPHDFVK